MKAHLQFLSLALQAGIKLRKERRFLILSPLLPPKKVSYGAQCAFSNLSDVNLK